MRMEEAKKRDHRILGVNQVSRPALLLSIPSADAPAEVDMVVIEPFLLQRDLAWIMLLSTTRRPALQHIDELHQAAVLAARI